MPMFVPQLYDYGQNFIRTQLATVQGAAIPLPYGGKVRAIMVDIDPNARYAKHLSATDVSNGMRVSWHGRAPRKCGSRCLCEGARTTPSEPWVRRWLRGRVNR